MWSARQYVGSQSHSDFLAISTRHGGFWVPTWTPKAPITIQCKHSEFVRIFVLVEITQNACIRVQELYT